MIIVECHLYHEGTENDPCEVKAAKDDVEKLQSRNLELAFILDCAPSHQQGMFLAYFCYQT